MIEETLANADALRTDFEAIGAGVGNIPRGVQSSEAFFVFATVGSHRPRQIVESGRALGKSTYLLARCFPDIPVLSIERDHGHPHAARALEHLKALPNVSCLFGDSRVLMPELVLPGDVVVIDGPKGHQALRLAMAIIKRKRPSFVFIHDCHKGSPLRRFLGRHLPWAFFSDDPRWVSASCRLDHYLDEALLSLWSDPIRAPTARSYAGTYACLPARQNFPSAADFARLALSQVGRGVFRLGNAPRPGVADAGT